MIKITTLNLQNRQLSFIGTIFSITRRAPTMFKGRGVYRLDFLMPTPELFEDYEAEEITAHQYMYGYSRVLNEETGEAERILGYSELLQARWPDVEDWLENLNPNFHLTLVTMPHEKCLQKSIYQLLKRYRPDIQVVLSEE